MGGEKETLVEKKESKSDKTKIGNFRIHLNNGEVHVHDDDNKLKVAIPVAAWWKIWDRIRNQPDGLTWLNPVNKTELKIESSIDDFVVDVKLSVSSVKFSDAWEKIDTFSKRK